MVQALENSMLDRHLTRYGTLLIKGGKVYMDGWEANDGVMCREMSALVCLHASQFLLEQARALIAKPGGNGLTCADMPEDTPREWLCEETQEFLANFDEVLGRAPKGPAE